MSAIEAIKGASAAGVRITLNGDNLALRAKAKPPDALLAELKKYKPEITAILRAAHPANIPGDEWLRAVAYAARLGYWINPYSAETKQ